jgi:hypothetical protein
VLNQKSGRPPSAPSRPRRADPGVIVSDPRAVAGVLRYRSPLRVFVVIVAALGVAAALIQDIAEIGYAGGGLLLLMLLYGRAPVQTIEVARRTSGSTARSCPSTPGCAATRTPRACATGSPPR